MEQVRMRGLVSGSFPRILSCFVLAGLWVTVCSVSPVSAEKPKPASAKSAAAKHPTAPKDAKKPTSPPKTDASASSSPSDEASAPEVEPAKTPAVAPEHPSNLFNDLGLKGDKSQNDAPLLVKSKTLSLDSRQRVFTYRGDVVADRGDLHITSDKMVGRYDDQNRIDTITAESNVVITRGEAMKATSNRAVYNVQRAIIEMTEGPELFRQGNALSADKVTIYVNEDRSEAEGNVQVKVIKSDSPTGAKPKGK